MSRESAISLQPPKLPPKGGNQRSVFNLKETGKERVRGTGSPRPRATWTIRCLPTSKDITKTQKPKTSPQEPPTMQCPLSNLGPLRSRMSHVSFPGPRPPNSLQTHRESPRRQEHPRPSRVPRSCARARSGRVERGQEATSGWPETRRRLGPGRAGPDAPAATATTQGAERAMLWFQKLPSEPVLGQITTHEATSSTCPVRQVPPPPGPWPHLLRCLLPAPSRERRHPQILNNLGPRVTFFSPQIPTPQLQPQKMLREGGRW